MLDNFENFPLKDLLKYSPMYPYNNYYYYLFINDIKQEGEENDSHSQ